MKFFLLLLALPLFTVAQKKGDTSLIVHVGDTTTMMTRLTIHLYEKGYLIDLLDESAAFVETKEMIMQNSSAFYKIAASIERNRIVFSAYLRIAKLTNDFNQVEYAGAKNSAAMKAWAAMEEIAKEFGKNINYK